MVTNITAPIKVLHFWRRDVVLWYIREKITLTDDNDTNGARPVENLQAAAARVQTQLLEVAVHLLLRSRNTSSGLKTFQG